MSLGNEQIPSVTAVIPACNAADTVARAIGSVYTQTYDNVIEAIVVDDGSSDDTAAIVHETFPDTTLLRQQNSGVSAARNAGVKQATGELVAFLDADDEWLPGKLEEQVAVMTARPGTALLLCHELTVPVDGPPRALPERDGIDQFTARDWLSGRAVSSGASLSCSGWVFRRDAFQRLGGFDRTLPHCEDFELAARTAATGYGTAVIPRPLFRRHMQERSVSQGPQSQLRRARKACEVVRRYDPQLDGLGHELLSQAEYEAILRRYLLHLFYHLTLAGEIDEAKATSREAAKLGGSIVEHAAAALGSRCPSVPTALFRMLHRQNR